MRPTLAPGDYLIITKARALRPGFVVLVDHPEYGVIVKSIEGKTLRLEGDGQVSTSPEEIGDVDIARIMGRARWAIKAGTLGLKSL